MSNADEILERIAAEDAKEEAEWNKLEAADGREMGSTAGLLPPYSGPREGNAVAHIYSDLESYTTPEADDQDGDQ
jgi:hypothetical protein